MEQIIHIDGNDVFVCKKCGKGWSFLCRDRIVFEDADAIWCYSTHFMSSKRQTYMLAEKNGQFALASEDGRLLFDFSHTMSEAIHLAEILLGQKVRFEKWLSA